MEANTPPCPCCGQPLPLDDRIRVDSEGGFIVANGHVTRPTETEFEVFEALWSNRPRVMTKEALMERLYWRRASGEEVEIKIIDVYVCKLRKRLKPLGLSIDTVWGKGYRILLGEATGG